MSAPARKFSLTKMFTERPALTPLPPQVAGGEGEPRLAAPPAAPASAPLAALPVTPAPQVEAASLPLAAQAVARPSRPAREASAASDKVEQHPKKKRSYSVDMKVCDDLEVIAWSLGRSSSSIVEDLMRRYVSGHREELERARKVKAELRA